MKLKEVWKKFWFILWKDDSFKGWALSLLFIFVFIKFIFFPGLSLLTGTSLPLAIVESCSMYHQGNLLSNFDNWWTKHESKYSQFNIEKQDFQDFIFKRGFNKGDILFVLGTKPEKLEVGDVIIFDGGQRTPIIHRIVDIKEEDGKKIFSTMGDNNPRSITPPNYNNLDETNIKESQIIGKAVFKTVPYVGWVKLIAVDIVNKIFYKGDMKYVQEGFCD